MAENLTAEQARNKAKIRRQEITNSVIGNIKGTVEKEINEAVNAGKMSTNFLVDKGFKSIPDIRTGVEKAFPTFDIEVTTCPQRTKAWVKVSWKEKEEKEN